MRVFVCVCTYFCACVCTGPPSLTNRCVLWVQLLSAMVAKLGNMDDPLPQDGFEGVDEDEWVSGRDEAYSFESLFIFV